RGARALWSHADDARRTRDARHLDRLLHRLAVADDLEGVVDATAGQLADLFDGVPVRAVDRVGRAELAGVLELVVEQIDSDDATGTDQRRALDHVQSDPAAADHGDAAARLHPGSVDHGPDSGR